MVAGMLARRRACIWRGSGLWQSVSFRLTDENIACPFVTCWQEAILTAAPQLKIPTDKLLSAVDNNQKIVLSCGSGVP